MYCKSDNDLIGNIATQEYSYSSVMKYNRVIIDDPFLI